MSDEKKKCPYCAEMIDAVASKCTICGEELNSSNSNQPPPGNKPLKSIDSTPPPGQKTDLKKKLKMGCGALIGVLLLLGLYSCIFGAREIDGKNLQKRDDLYYETNSNKPFTGIASDIDTGDYVSIKNGKFHGTQEKHYRDGVVKSTYHFKDGSPHGKQFEYYPNEQVKMKAVFKNGIILSEENYASNGKLENRIVYDYRKDIHTVTETDSNNRLVSIKRTNAETDSYEGEQVRYYEGNLHWKENYRNGKLHGEQIKNFTNGTLYEKKNYKDGILDGELLAYYENGKLHMKKHYAKGQYDGEQTEYYDNGKPKSKQTYKNNKLIGEEQYAQGGQMLAKVNRKGDIIIPESTFWNDENQITSKVVYDKDRNIIREQYTYHPNGKLKSIERRLGGRLEGYQENYYSNGSLKSKHPYHNGEQDRSGKFASINNPWKCPKCGQAVNDEDLICASGKHYPK